MGKWHRQNLYHAGRRREELVRAAEMPRILPSHPGGASTLLRASTIRAEYAGTDSFDALLPLTWGFSNSLTYQAGRATLTTFHCPTLRLDTETDESVAGMC